MDTIRYKRINELFGTEYKSNSKIDWVSISKFYVLSEDFIREFKDYLDWCCISTYQVLSESFIEEFCGKVNWRYISEYQVLTENFIRRYKDKVNWNFISCNQILSWEFIMEFKDRVDWRYISMCQPYIDPKSSMIDKKYLKLNDLSRLYQTTKERGWFMGYIYLDCEKLSRSYYFFTLDPTKCTTSKVKIYWKDLLTRVKAKKIELIRIIKYV